jgi:iron complex outermembrane recepter protein
MLSSRRVLALTVTLVTVCSIPALALAQGQTTDQSNQSGATTSPPTPGTAPDAAPAAPADASADVTVQPTTKSKFGEEIVVTGSRIRRKDLTTPAPVTVLSREQVQASGKVSIGDFLQSLPEQGNAINTSINNGGDGATRINLRSLGTQRTLVLLNGRRFVPGGTGADGSVDLNSIPASAIERVEVLKDGASAVYGSDAIAGVVNIITRKKFSGTEASAYFGRSTHGDGNTYDASITSGVSGDRGNLLFNAGFFKQESVFAGSRDFSKIPIAFDGTGDNGSASGLPGVYSIGSGTVPEGTVSITKGDTGGNALWNKLTQDNPKSSKFIRVLGQDANTEAGWRPYRGSFLAQDGGDGYNFQPANYLVTPQQRIQLFSTGDTKLGDAARGYFEASYVNRSSTQLLAAEPLVSTTAGANGVVMSADSIYNPFQRDFQVFQRRLLEFGGRQFNQDIDTFRVVGGVDGTLGDTAGPLRGWFWDLSLNYGRTTGSQLTQGSLRTPNLQAALGPSMRDPTTGQPICVAKAGDATTAIAGCVPIDLLHVNGAITPDQIANLTFAGTARGVNQLTAFQANTSGELFPLFSDRPLGLAVGYEFRNVLGAFIPDPVTAAGETTGNAQKATSGSYHVNEGYAELSVPIINHVPLAENLEATAAARVFDYSNFGSDYTYKFGARWSILPEVTFRGTYSTAFRAPSIGDLFLGQSDNFPSVKDPCRGPGISGGGAVPAACALQGVGPGGSGDDQTQLRSKIGGNPLLQPETAKIYTLGIVLEPASLVRNLTFTVDYYNVGVDNAISTIGETTILSSCYPANGGAPASFCNLTDPTKSLVQRDPTTGRITTILNTNLNVGKEFETGIDFAMRYGLPTRAYGRFNFVVDATWLRNHDITLADGTTIHGRGNFDLSSQAALANSFGVNPAWKGNAGVLWGLGNFGAGVSTKFVGSFKECSDAGGDFSGSGLCFQDHLMTRKVSAWNSWDAFVSYTLPSPAGRTNIGLGVQNAFDAKPSAIFNGFTAASDPSAYDFMGRFLYVRLTHSI